MCLDVVFSRSRGAVAVVLGGASGACGLWTAEAAQQSSGQQEEHSSGPADEDARAELSAVRRIRQRVLEVAHDVVGRPADWDDEQQAGDEHAHARRQADLRLGVLVFHTRGELSAGEQHQQGDRRHHAAHNGHGTSCLDV